MTINMMKINLNTISCSLHIHLQGKQIHREPDLGPTKSRVKIATIQLATIYLKHKHVAFSYCACSNSSFWVGVYIESNKYSCVNREWAYFREGMVYTPARQ